MTELRQNELLGAAAIALPASGPSVYRGTIDTVYDNVGPQTGDVAQNGLTDDLRPQMSGTLAAAAGQTIKVWSNTHFAGFVHVDSTGHWSFTPGSNLAVNQDYYFQISMTDPATNTEIISEAFHFTTTTAGGDDTSTPAAATDVHLMDDVGPITGEIKNNGVTDDNKPTLSGHATVGDVVKIYDTNNHYLGETTVAANGTWSFTPTTALVDGKHSFTAVVENPANGHDSAATTAINFTVDTHASVSVTGLMDHSGVKTGLVANGGKSDDLNPTLMGTAEPNSTIHIHETVPSTGYSYNATVIAGSDGKWSWDFGCLQTGIHNYTVYAIDPAGNTSAAVDYAFERVLTNQDAPADPAITSFYDDVGLHQGNVGEGGKTDDVSPLLSGTAEADSLVHITRTGPNGATYTVGSAIADKNGHWQLQTTNAMAVKGNYSFHISASATGYSAHGADYHVTYVGSNGDVTTQAFSENFEDDSHVQFYSGGTYHLDYFDVHVTNSGTAASYSPGINNIHYGVSRPVSSTAMIFSEGTNVHLTMKNPLTDISFQIGDLTTNEHLTVKYYDISGTLIHTESHTQGEGLLTTASYTAPSGEQIGSMDISMTNPGNNTIMTYAWIDNMQGHYVDNSVQATFHSAVPGLVDMTTLDVDMLQLTTSDILSQAHQDLLIADNHQQMVIKGNTGDTVDLKVADVNAHEWQDTGHATSGGVQYEVYQHAGDNLELLVQHGVELHLTA